MTGKPYGALQRRGLVTVPLWRLCRGFTRPPFSQLDKDDMVYMEAYDKLLESWLALVQDDKHFHKGFFTQHAIQVFNSYIQCHLAAPDGTRNLVSAQPGRSRSVHPRPRLVRFIPLHVVSC